MMYFYVITKCIAYFQEAETERVVKIQAVTIKSDIHNALDSFMEHQKHMKEHVKEKVDTAAENRAKKFREMKEKLKEKEAHAALVRTRKRTVVPVQINDGTADQIRKSELPPLTNE